MEARTDLDALRRHVPVPAGLSSVRWAGRARNAGGTPGPTDLEVLAYFPLDAAAWEAVSPGLGRPGPRGTFEADPGLVAAVLPPGEAAGPGQVAGERWSAAAFENASWSAPWAIRTQGGLVVHLLSR